MQTGVLSPSALLRRSFAAWLLGAALALAATGSVARAAELPPPGPEAAVPPFSGDALRKLPLVFEPTDAPGTYVAAGAGAEYLLSPAGVTIRWVDLPPRDDHGPLPGSPRDATGDRWRRAGGELVARGRPRTVRLDFKGADPHAQLVPLEELPGKVNVLSGSDPSGWRTGLATYAKVACKGLYPGIDLLFYGAGWDLEFDLVVSPGADPSAVRFLLGEGDEGGIRLKDGNALLSDGPEALRLVRPAVYQEVSGKRVPVAGDFQLNGDGSLGFRLGTYDARLPLVIDPATQWSTYIGGSSIDQANAVTMDSSGFIYIAGQTYSSNFPVVGGLGQVGGFSPFVFVMKLSADGKTIQWSTLVRGPSSATAYGIALDASNDVFISGTTGTGFPTVNAFQSVYGGGNSDAFVAKLNPTGSALLFATYLGGSGQDQGVGIAVDGQGNCVVTGSAGSANFPVLNAYQSTLKGVTNAFLSKFSPTGTLLFSTLLGGSGGGYGLADNGVGAAVDGSGNVFVTGQAYSPDFPTTPGCFQPTCKGCTQSFQDAFLSKFSPSGTLLYSTFFGGNSASTGQAVACDPTGHAYVAGESWATDLPVTPGSAQPFASGGGKSDGFVAEFAPDGSQVLACTYAGGTDSDYLYGLTYVPLPGGGGYLAAVGTSNSGLDCGFPAVGANPTPPATAFNTVSAGANNGLGSFNCGAFTTSAGVPMTSRVFAADMNNDGLDDMVGLVPTKSEVYTKLRTGSGIFGAPLATSTDSLMPTDAVVTDLDGDGKQDLVIACRQSHTDHSMGAINILYGYGTGFFRRSFKEWRVPGQPVGIAVGDVNGDGLPDLITAEQNAAGGTISVFLQNPAHHGSFLPAINTAVPGPKPYKLAVMDVNHDGKPDVALLYPMFPGGWFSADSVGLFTGDGTGHFASAGSLVTGTWPLDMAIADMDGDGTPDLAVLNYGDGTMSVFRGLSTTPWFAAPVVVPAGGGGSYPENFFFGRLHASGVPDVVVTYPVYGQAPLILTNTSAPGSVSFTSATFNCQHQAYVAFGHFFTLPTVAGKAAENFLPFDLLWMEDYFYDDVEKFLFFLDLEEMFWSMETTGDGPADGFGVAGSSGGTVNTVGEAGAGASTPSSGGTGFQGGYWDAFLFQEFIDCGVDCGAYVDPIACANTPSEFDGWGEAWGPCTGAYSYDWDFGDGSPHATTQSAEHTYAGAGNYTWTYTVYFGARSCTRSGTIHVCLATCNAGATPTSGAPPLQVAFTASASGCDGTPTYVWNFGDGGASEAQNPVHTYQNPGAYTWTVTATFDDGCSCTSTGSVSVCELTCETDVPATGCTGEAVGFYATSTPTGSCLGEQSYTWDFGDGGGASTLDASHTYTSPGTYHWTFYVDLGPLTCSQEGDIKVCSLTCDASADRIRSCVGDTIGFTASGTLSGNCAGDLTYAWDFGDNSGGSGASVTHSYSVPGNYGWTVTVSGAGCTCTKSGSVCVFSAQAIVNPNAFAGCPATFSALNSAPSCFDGTPTYTWTFGDGAGGTGQDAAHAYAQAGDYTWTLSVNYGAVTCTTSGSIHVCTLTCQVTTAPNPASGFAPLTVGFAATATITGGCFGFPSYSWTFGDGTTSTAQNPAPHVYNTPGAYNWTMTASVGNCTCVQSGTVCVFDCSASGPAAPVCFPAGANFTASGLPAGCAGAITWAWTFGDGGTSNVQNPGHNYAAAGSYFWSCTITINGATCTQFGTALVCNPTCSATVPAQGIIGGAVNFVADVNAGPCANQPITWTWTFGDGTGANTQNAIHLYAAQGIYPWTMTVTVGGCTCVQAGAITVLPPCAVTCTATVPTGGFSGLAVAFASTATTTNCQGLPVSYAWGFGDPGSGAANTSAAQNPTHTYASPGTYTWTLTVTVGGITCSKTGDITITRPPLAASATANPPGGPAPLNVCFTGGATGGLAPYAFAWTFGDGGTSNAQNPCHPYATPGTYAATLTVTDALAGTATATVSVPVWPPLAVSLSASPTVGSPPLLVTFNAAITGGVPPYAPTWHYGDGTEDQNLTSTHTYAAAGTYHATLTVQDSAGASVTTNPITITAVPPPVITALKKGAPFQITVTGSNLQSGIKVYINGTLWTNVTYKSVAKIVIKGGNSLKAVVPKGVTTTFKFVNPDGGSATTTFTW